MDASHQTVTDRDLSKAVIKAAGHEQVYSHAKHSALEELAAFGITTDPVLNESLTLSQAMSALREVGLTEAELAKAGDVLGSIVANKLAIDQSNLSWKERGEVLGLSANVSHNTIEAEEKLATWLKKETGKLEEYKEQLLSTTKPIEVELFFFSKEDVFNLEKIQTKDFQRYINRIVATSIIGPVLLLGLGALTNPTMSLGVGIGLLFPGAALLAKFVVEFEHLNLIRGLQQVLAIDALRNPEFFLNASASTREFKDTLDAMGLKLRRVNNNSRWGDLKWRIELQK